MKKYLTLIFLIFVYFLGIGQQINVQYKSCPNCTGAQKNDDDTIFYGYGAAQAYNAQHVVSDFGPRILGTDFHGGVDFSADTNEQDKGDLILAIESGRITAIVGGFEYKYMVIAGDDNHHYEYGHIFRTATVGSTGHLKSGNMVLKAIDGSSPVIYAIIFLGYNENDTPIALCQFAGLTVTWNNQTITTRNTVSAGDPIAPIGDSYRINSENLADTLESHLHLYRYPSIPHRNDDAFVNNPLENLIYPQADLTATLLHGDAIVGSDFRPLVSSDIKGGELSKIRVRCRISNTISGSNTRYSAIPNIDEVRLKLKRSDEDDEKYELMRGSSFDAKISLGGRQVAGNPYPEYIKTTPAYNGVTATNLINGVKPFMYNNGYPTRPYDEYIFSDIVTGLHKNDPKEQKTPYAAPMLATWQKDARYTDGEYQLRAEVLRINNEVVTSAPLTFTIDNFKPYLESVRVTLDGKQANDPIYAAAWNFNSTLNEGKGGLQNRVSQQNAVTETSYLTDRKLRIRAKYSEGMKTQYLLIKDAKGNNVLPTQIVTASETEYDYIFEYNDIDRILSQETNTYTIHASGKDYANNGLLNLHKMTGYPNNMVIPYKKADNTWSATAIDAANDESFVFDIQGTCSGNGGILPEEVVVRSP